MAKDNKVTVTVTSLSGNMTDEFNVHQKLRHVMEKAFNELHIVPAAGEEWQLRYNDTVLNLEQSLEDAHIPDNATLTLAPREGGGGGAWTSM